MRLSRPGSALAALASSSPYHPSFTPRVVRWGQRVRVTEGRTRECLWSGLKSEKHLVAREKSSEGWTRGGSGGGGGGGERKKEQGTQRNGQRRYNCAECPFAFQWSCCDSFFTRSVRLSVTPFFFLLTVLFISLIVTFFFSLNFFTVLRKILLSQRGGKWYSIRGVI